MAGYKPRGTFHVFRLLLILALVASLLAAAAELPAAPAVPPAQHGDPGAEQGQTAAADRVPQTVEEEPQQTAEVAEPDTADLRPSHARNAEIPGTTGAAETTGVTETTGTSSSAETDQEPEIPSKLDAASQRAPRVCTAAVPLARAAAAGDALPYMAAPAEPQPGALAGLEQLLQAYLATLNGTYGVAVTDLTTGATAAVLGDQVFVAASTFKVPLAMYVFSLVEAGEADLEEPVYYAPEDWEGGAGVLHGAIPGDCYTVAELVNLALTVSDNIATNMLLRRFGDENVFGYMRELGGTVTNLETGRRATTPRDMALYIELLYRWAAREDGGLYRTLMGLLTQTAFSDRIAAGAPAGVPVAHKIGTLPAMVHDVGIVFLPDRPFAIAILSAGVNEQAAAARLADITRIVSAYLSGEAQPEPGPDAPDDPDSGTGGGAPGVPSEPEPGSDDPAEAGVEPGPEP